MKNCELLLSVTGNENFTIDNKIAVIATSDSVLTKAQKIALRLHLPLVNGHNTTHPFLLAVTPERLELWENNATNHKPIFVDFLTPQIIYRTKYGGGKNQLIAKAIGVSNKKKPVVLDATAGFGIDAFVLASLGCEVTMLERSPVISALLVDGLERLRSHRHPGFTGHPSDKNINLTLKSTPSFDYMDKIIQENLEKPDVIYLDPMYPKRSKSALNKKTMRILHELVGSDNDAAKLLAIALKCAKNRVVVKRPKYTGYLGELKPNLQFFSGGSSRYDVYFSSLLKPK